ncbi:phosphatidylserine synthase [Fluviicoccus keumensis]|uniref:Phosphatidylserine synthase n=1 Tax=Fluviicoccus keumensis TaxID=1435465 RepID=A0A4Q7ZDS1_9GAMM|nr:CDP-alcohol phosphatidyltransferase family protein [Fluviicoccus keumensis]RZU48195.1 phosphatidylserine synthase [Fluviicoccus keumensis]
MKHSDRYIIRLNPVDCLTLSGVVTSLGALALALKGQFYLAAALLFIAMLGDALDGMLARKYRLERPFGRYLDGFMDVLIYLVTPAFILYTHGMDGFWSIPILIMVASGCVRLAVFNDIGNIQEETGGLAYLGMPVFWSVLLLAGFLLADFTLPALWLNGLMTLVLLSFSHNMLLRRPFFKFTKLWQILAITLGGAAIFLVLHVSGRIPLV